MIPGDTWRPVAACKLTSGSGSLMMPHFEWIARCTTVTCFTEGFGEKAATNEGDTNSKAAAMHDATLIMSSSSSQRK